MDENGNITKQRAYHKDNFTIIHNEILFKNKELNKRVSLDALGLFWRIMSLPPNWKLNSRGLASISDCGIDKINNCMKELIDFGYVKVKKVREKGKFSSNIYEVTETLRSDIWNTEKYEIVNTKNEQKDSTYGSEPGLPNPRMEKPRLAKPRLANPDQYKYVINKNINKNKNNINYKISKNSKSKDLDLLNENFNNINNNNMSNETFPEINYKNDNMAKNLLAQTEELVIEEPAYKKRQKERQAKRDKNRQKEILEQQNKKKENLEDLTDKKLSEQTEQEKFIAYGTRMIRKIEEEQKTLERKQQIKKSKIKLMIEKIENDIKDFKLATNLKDYFTMWIKSGKPLTEEIIDSNLRQLNNLNKDTEKQSQIVLRSLNKGWFGFYPLEGQKEVKINNTGTPEYTQSIKEKFGEDAFELATDENGNVMTF